MITRPCCSTLAVAAWFVIAVLVGAGVLAVSPAPTAAFDWEGAFGSDDEDLTPRQLEAFDRYLATHPAVAEDLRARPWRATDPAYLDEHPGLRRFLADHPGVRRELEEDPRGIMREVEQYRRRAQEREREQERERAREQERERQRAREQERAQERERDAHRRGYDVTDADIRAFDRFLDDHPNVRHDLRADPWLAQRRRYLRNHESFDDFLDDYPTVRDELAERPRDLLRRVDRYHDTHHKPPPKKKSKKRK